MSERPYAKGGVIEGSIPVHVMVRQLEGNDYREYWDPELGRWVRIFTAEQIRDLGTEALEELNREADRG